MTDPNAPSPLPLPGAEPRPWYRSDAVTAGAAVTVLVAAVVALLAVILPDAAEPTLESTPTVTDTTTVDDTDVDDPTDLPTATPGPTPLPYTRPTAPGGIEFFAYPFVNDRGTYFSTLGAPPEYTPWINSASLIWNQRLPDDTPAVPNSATIAQQIHETVAGRRFVDYQSAVETNKNAPYVLLVDSSREHFVRLESDCFGFPHNGWGWDDVQFEQYINNVYPGRDGIPMPPEFAMDIDDGDYAVTIYDYHEDILFDFWVFKSSNLTGGAPSACWGGVIRDYSTVADGIFPYPVGGSASGLTAAGTIITLEDLRQGSIDHVLSVSTLQILNELHLDDSRPSASYPANRNDGVCATSPKEGWDIAFHERVMAGVESVENCLREGQRLRFPAGFDVSAIEHPVARMIAEAVRDYGIVVHDFGACFCIQAESGRAVEENGFGLDPWVTAYAETPDWEIMVEIPWDQLEVLPTDWGMPAGYQRPCIETYTWVETDPACERRVPPYESG